MSKGYQLINDDGTISHADAIATDNGLTLGQLNPRSTVVWMKFTKTFTDLSVASLTNDIEIYNIPAYGVINSAFTKITQTFTGGTIAAYTIGCGTSGNHNAFTGNVAINALSGLNSIQSNNGNPLIQSLTSSTSIRLYAISVGDTLDHATQGSIDVYLQVSFLQ